MSKTYKIVILEDDRILLKALNIELLSSGFEVLSATDGESGLKLISREKPDLVLLDLVMPKIDGFEVLTKLKKNKDTKNIPVIILSNLGQDEEIKKGLKLGALDYYKKASTDLRELSNKIKGSLP
ncbi:response regulator [Candidatus Parcubacteria bacterium]|nr:response regulator [Candidatus Parcubacteria bacterium]